MVIKSNTILYFSGTGNSLQVAKDLADQLQGFHLLPISSLQKEDSIQVEADTLGIVFPVYYARLPLMVEETIKKLSVQSNTYVFAAATCGGTPATVLNKLRNLLQKNGVFLNSGFLIKMPANHVCEYNTRSVAPAHKVFKREMQKVMQVSRVVRERKNHKPEVSKWVIDTLIDKLFSKVTDRIFQSLHSMDRKFWVTEECCSCGLCERICPAGNIDFNAKPVWKHQCERCMACIQHCPRKAIQSGDKTVKRDRYTNPNV